MKKQIILLILCCLSLPFLTEAQIKKVAILETVDKEGNISYAHKLMLRTNLAKAVSKAPGYEAYDRTDMNAIMDEQNFQRTGMVSDDQIKRLGEMTGAAYILVAEAVRVDDNNMFITAKILNVETAKTEITDNALMGTTASDIQHGCESLASNLLGINIASSQPASTASAPQITTVQAPSGDLPAPLEGSKGLGSLMTFADGSKGIVFFESQGHGYVVSLDQAILQWETNPLLFCQDIASLVNAKPPFFTELSANVDGLAYTKIICESLGQAAAAAQWCVAHGEGWHLPSVGECNLLLINNGVTDRAQGPVSARRVANGGAPLDAVSFWTSNESSQKKAMVTTAKKFMGMGPLVDAKNKTDAHWVVAVRAF